MSKYGIEDRHSPRDAEYIPVDHHDENCDIYFKHETTPTAKNYMRLQAHKAYWCATHNQWTYNFPGEVTWRYESMKMSDERIKQIVPLLQLNDELDRFFERICARATRNSITPEEVAEYLSRALSPEMSDDWAEWYGETPLGKIMGSR